MEDKIDIKPGVNRILVKAAESCDKQRDSGVWVPGTVKNETGVESGVVFRASKTYVDSKGIERENPYHVGQTVFFRMGAGMFSAAKIPLGEQELVVLGIEDVLGAITVKTPVN